MGLTKTFIVTLALATVASAVPCLEVPPAWARQFEVRGVLVVPSLQIEEPLRAWYDSDEGKSRIDYYGGTSSIYQMSYLPTRKGSYSLVVPVTTENFVNQKTCLQWPGNGDVWPLSIVPDLGGYKCQGDDIVNGVPAQKWTYTVVIDGEFANYTMWINWTKNEKTGANVPAPVFYEFDGPDYYYIKFSDYKVGTPEKSIWNDVLTMKCAPSGPAEIKFQPDSDPAESVLQYHELHMNSAWSHFLHIRSKMFGAVPEHIMRKSTFRKNYKLVLKHNSERHNYKLALNQFADWTKEEMQGLKARFQSKHTVGSSAFPYKQNELRQMSETLPKNMDWRAKGAVTHVKNQFNCGSGWSFATTGVIEGAHFVKTGKLTNLSEQALIDCSWGFNNGGCNGGLEHNAYQWVMKHGGLPLEVEYPYLSMNGKCHFNETELHASITGWVSVPAHNENALKVALFKNGPISVAMNADPATFMFYSSGVYDDASCSSGNLDHTGLAVGYGVKNGQDYWLIKNSWSTNWGEEGYILISAKNNICGVTTDASYVTM